MKTTLLPSTDKKTKVAIVGFTDSRKRAPFDEPGWEIWGLNAIYELFPDWDRWDRWFELHKREVNLGDEGPQHIWELSEMTCPIYMQHHYEDIPSSVTYPLDSVLAQFRPYLTSTFSFMAALAIMEGFEEIGVYGVDTADEEWGSQRPSLEYLLGYAEGKGIKVTIPSESSLLRAPFIYAYQEREEQQFFGKLLNEEGRYQRGLERATEKRLQYQLAEAGFGGALRAVQALRKEWRLPFNLERREVLEQERASVPDISELRRKFTAEFRGDE